MRIYTKHLRIDEENYILMFDVDNGIWYLKKMRIDIKKWTYIDEEIVKLIFDVDIKNWYLITMRNVLMRRLIFDGNDYWYLMKSRVWT